LNTDHQLVNQGSMYVIAAGTGSALEGAKMLFAFGIGTLPVLLSFGVLATLVSSALTHRLLKASGAIGVVLGAGMINRGLILIGSGYDLRTLVESFRETNKLNTQISLASMAPSSQDKIEQTPVQDAAPHLAHDQPTKRSRWT
jgi:sulfite exporter TauE/SafE